jgi:hypothetical protein
MNIPFLVKKHSSVAAAVAPLQEILINLEEVVARKQLEAAEARLEISELEVKADAARDEALKASNVFQRLREVIGG